MNVFELFATLGLDTSSYDQGLKSAEDSASSFSSALTTGLSVATGVATTAIVATGTAVVGATTAFAEGIQEVSEYGDAIDKNAQKLGLSNSAYQEWDYVLNIAGTSMSNLTTGVKTLTNKIDDAKNGNEDAIASFEALGISLEDLETMSREDIFEATIYGFTELADSTERASLANDLFGRSGQELTPLFNMTEEEISSLIDTANEYGMVMSDEAVSASATYTDSLTTLENTISGIKNNLLSEFLPSISTVMDGLSAVFAGDDSGLGLIEEGVDNFISTLDEIIPVAIEIGSKILTSLSSAIVKNFPELYDAGTDALLSFVDAIFENADLLIDSAKSIISTFTDKLLDSSKAGELTQVAVDVITELASAIADALPILIPAIVSVVKTIVETLTTAENLAMIMDVALEILSAFDQSIVQIAPEITNMIIPLLWNILQAVVTELPDLIAYLFEHIVYTLASFWGTILGLFGVGFDDIKAYFELFDIDIFNIAESIAVNGILWFESAWDFITTWFGNALTGIGEFVADIIEAVVNFGQNAWNSISSTFNNIKNTVSTILNNIKTFIPNALDYAKNQASSKLDEIKNTFTSVFDNVKSTVENAINFIKGLFDFEWSLPELKMPHFSISGEFDLLATPPSIPSVSVEWYAKAMNEPYLLDSATIFGATSGRLMGAGEAGSEMIYGRDQLMADIGAVVDAKLSNMEFIVPVYIGGKKIDQQVVMANARNSVISGGR